MSEIAGRWTKEPAKTTYKNAAERFRLPYWDPLKPRYRVKGIPTRNGDVLNEQIWGAPAILTKPKVFVKRWDKDGPQEIDNPLFRFEWKNDAIEAKGRTSMKGVSNLHDDIREQVLTKTPHSTSLVRSTPLGVPHWKIRFVLRERAWVRRSGSSSLRMPSPSSRMTNWLTWITKRETGTLSLATGDGTLPEENPSGELGCLRLFLLRVGTTKSTS